MGLVSVSKSDKKGLSLKTAGLVCLIAGALGLMFSLYMLIFGVKVSAEFTKLTPAKQKYINHYVYTVDGKEYEYTERVSRDRAGQEGDTVTVRYLSANPDVTYNSNLLALSEIFAATGGVSLIFAKKSEA